MAITLGQILAENQIQLQKAFRKQETLMMNHITKNLEQLDNLPLEEIESRAKSHEIWHPKGSGYVPVAGDLVPFKLEKNGISSHVGIVTDMDQNRKLHVIYNKSHKKGDKSGIRTTNALFEVNDPKIRGFISRPGNKFENFEPPPPSASISSLIKLGQLHKNILTLMSDLLKPAPKE